MFKLGQSKKMKCQFCEHKGRSIVSEQQPWLTLVVIITLYFQVGFWFIVFVPIVVGLLRK